MSTAFGREASSQEGFTLPRTPLSLIPPSQRWSDSEPSNPASPVSEPSSPLTFDGMDYSKSPNPEVASGSSVKVFVRARPFSTKEAKEESQSVLDMKGGKVSLLDPRADYKVRATFKYTAAFPPEFEPEAAAESQKALFDQVGRPALDSVFEGYNACILAYGQTGSGKTYTMMGAMTNQNMGIIPRLGAHLFARVEAIKQLRPCRFDVEASYCEVYNEKVHDLLASKSKVGEALKIRQGGKTGTYVEGISEHKVTSMKAILKLIARGNERRATAATELNDQSSRSHAVFTINLIQLRIQNKGDDKVKTKETRSVIHLVDLAGSERIKLSGVTGQQLEEAKNVNLSLSTLGRVIEALVQSSSAGKRVEVPYRESALTWMLRNSFGGNSKTIMIATVSPAASSVEETLNTLRYASRARQVVNKAVVNVKEEVRLADEFKAEMAEIQQQLLSAPELYEQEEKITALTEQLLAQQDLLSSLQDETQQSRRMAAHSEKELQRVREQEAQERAGLEQRLLTMERERGLERKRWEDLVEELQAELNRKAEAVRQLERADGEHRQRIAQLEKQLEAAKAHPIQTEAVRQLERADGEHRQRIAQLEKQHEAAKVEALNASQLVQHQNLELQQLERANGEHRQRVFELEKHLENAKAECANVSQSLENATTQQQQRTSDEHQQRIAELEKQLHTSRTGASAALKKLQMQNETLRQLEDANGEYRQHVAQLKKQLETVMAESATALQAAQAKADRQHLDITAARRSSATSEAAQWAWARRTLAAEESEGRNRLESEERDATLRGVLHLQAGLARAREAELSRMRLETSDHTGELQQALARKAVLKMQVKELERKVQELELEAVTHMEQFDTLEGIMNRLSAEYNSRLSKLISDSDEFQRMVNSMAPYHLEEEPAAPPKPLPTLSIANFFFPSKASRSASPPVKPAPPRPTSSHNLTRRPSSRTPSLGASEFRRSLGGRSSSKILGEDDVEADREEIMRLKMQVRVLETNLELTQNTLRSVAREGGMDAETRAL